MSGSSRAKQTKTLVSFLKKKINCANIDEFVNDNIDANSSIDDDLADITINKMISSYKLITLDSSNSERIKPIFNYFDFITEANYQGTEMFPYLYGIVTCETSEYNKLHIFLEKFDGNLLKLFSKIEHPSEWYDIVFQIIMINYFTHELNQHNYPNGNMKNHFYKKLAKPYYQEYQLNNTLFKVNHKYTIVMWNLELGETFGELSDSDFKSNVQYLLDFIESNPDIPIKPSPRIITMLTNITKPDTNTIELILEHYDQK